MSHRLVPSVGFVFFLGVTGWPRLATEPGKKEKPKALQIGIGTKPFDVTRHSVELSEIVQGGPPRDGIPALVDPRFVSAAEARRFMSDDDEVLGLVEGRMAKAYPLKILNHHEVVNDRLEEKPIAVTY